MTHVPVRVSAAGRRHRRCRRRIRRCSPCRRAASVSKRMRHDRAAARAVGEGDRAEMLLDDLLDDREAEAGAARARRHIGLDDAVALGGQADAVVGDGDARRASSSPARSSSRPRPRSASPPRASIASTAFLTILVSAWPIWRRSQTSVGADRRRVEREADRRDARPRAGTSPGARYRPAIPRGTPAWASARRRRIRRPCGADRRPGGRSCRSAARRCRRPRRRSCLP